MSDRQITKTAGGTGPHALELGVEPVYVVLCAHQHGGTWLDPGDVFPTEGMSPSSIAVLIQRGWIQQVIVPNGYRLEPVKEKKR